MSETDKRYYKISINGSDHIFTNVQKHYDYYTANETSQTGKAGKFVHLLSQAEIDRAVITDSFVFVEKPADFVFQFYLVNASEYESGNKLTSIIYLEFPQQANDIKNAFEKIGLPPDAKPGQYFITECESILKRLNPLMEIHSDIHELADTAKQLDTLDGFNMLKLNAIMESNAKFENLAQVKEFTYNRDYYDIEFDISDHTELGLSRIYRSGACEDMPDYYKDAINPTDFGRYIAEAERGFFASRGYLYQTGEKWRAVDLPDFKPKPLIDGADERPIDTIENFAADFDSFFRGMSEAYAHMFDDEIQARYFMLSLVQTGRTDTLRTRISALQNEYHLDNADVQPLIQRIENFERCKGIEPEHTENNHSIKRQLETNQRKRAKAPTKSKNNDLVV